MSYSTRLGASLIEALLSVTGHKGAGSGVGVGDGSLPEKMVPDRQRGAAAAMSRQHTETGSPVEGPRVGHQ